MMIDALMYGVILIAKIVAWLKAPPENVFKRLSNESFPPCSIRPEITSGLKNGTGITEPNLKITINKSV